MLEVSGRVAFTFLSLARFEGKVLAVQLLDGAAQTHRGSGRGLGQGGLTVDRAVNAMISAGTRRMRNSINSVVRSDRPLSLTNAPIGVQWPDYGAKLLAGLISLPFHRLKIPPYQV